MSLYGFNGGGSVRDGIAVWGADVVCRGSAVTLFTCGDAPFSWSSSAPAVASVSGNGNAAAVQGLTGGAATITATDANGKTGSRTLTVVQPGISPSYFVTCDGAINTLVVTNADVTGGVTWSIPGTISANTRTNTLGLFVGGNVPAAGTNVITAWWNGCSATATAVVVQVAALTASTNNLCGGGQVIYSTASWPPGFENTLSWSGEGLSGAGPTRTNNYSTPGIKSVTVSCGVSALNRNVTVHKIDITNATEYGLAGSTLPVNFRLSADSVGPFTWLVAPEGPSITGGASGTNVAILPGSIPGAYTVRCLATPLPSCQDTATLQVVQVTFSTGSLALCEGGTSNLTISVSPPSAVSLLSFDTVTNTATGPANTHASVSVNNGTNLTVTGTVAGAAWLRVKLGASTLIGPALQIVRVTFPPEAWYVGVGKMRDFTNVTVIPSGAPVTFDTATAEAISGGVKVAGVAPGTTQVRAKVGSGLVCATKDLTAVRAQLSTNVVALCNGNNITVSVDVEPGGAPVDYSVSNSNIVQLAIQGTNLTITAKTGGTAIVAVRIDGKALDWLQVKSVHVSFPTNDWLALRDVPHVFKCRTSPQLYARLVQFSLSDSNIATLAPTPPRLTVTGKTNGSTQITAEIGINQSCAVKGLGIFRAELQNIEFTSDHNLICDGPDELTVGNRYPNVEWNPGANPPSNAPMTHTAGTNTKVSAILGLALDGLPTGATWAISGASEEPALTFAPTNSIFVQTSSPIGREIRRIEKSIIWTLHVSGNALPLGKSGPHTIFTTLGTPDTSAVSNASVPNVARMVIATERLKKAIEWTNDVHAYTCYPRMVWRIMADVGNYYLYNQLNYERAWLLPKERADCASISRFVRNVCRVMGIPGEFASNTFIALYATPDDPARPTRAGVGSLGDTNGNAVVYPGLYGTNLTPNLNTNWFLAFADSNCRPYGRENDPTAPIGEVGCYGGINSFEAALIYGDPSGKVWFFPAGVAGNPRYSNPNAIIHIFRSMVWAVFEDHDGNPSTATKPVVKAVEYRYTRQQDVELCSP